MEGVYLCDMRLFIWTSERAEMETRLSFWLSIRAFMEISI